jgi:hypothetical protein
VSFTFQKIEWDYTPLDPVTFQPQTTITGGWDVGQNQPLAKGSASPLMLKMK